LYHKNHTYCFTYKNPPKPLPITLVCALQRPKTLKKIVFTATSLGIKEIVFINTAKVEKAYWDKRQHKLDDTIIKALEQAKDTIPPTIQYHKQFKPFAQDVLATLIKDKAYVAHPTHKKTVIKKATSKTHTTLIIGPEGGFTTYEVTQLQKHAKVLSLGTRILRTEDALPVAIGKLL